MRPFKVGVALITGEIDEPQRVGPLDRDPRPRAPGRGDGLRHRLDARRAARGDPRGQTGTGLLGGRRDGRGGRGRDLADQGRDLGAVGAAPQPGHHRQGRRDPRRDQRRPLHLRARCRPRLARPGPRVRPPGGPRLRAVRGVARDHRPAAARRPRGLRGHATTPPRPRAASRRARARADPDHARPATGRRAPPRGPAMRTSGAATRSARAPSPSSGHGSGHSRRRARRSDGTRRPSAARLASRSRRSRSGGSDASTA